MHYKKLTDEGCTPCAFKILTILYLVFSFAVWIVLFLGLYKLNNDFNELKEEHENLIYKLLTVNEFDVGYSTEDFSDYYDYEEGTTEEEVPISSLFGGGSLTKDDLENKRLKREIAGTIVDGVTVNSESYAEVKKRNRTTQPYFRSYLTPPETSTTEQAKHDNSVDRDNNSDGSTLSTSTPTVYTRRSKVMQNEGRSKHRGRSVKRPRVKSFDSISPDQTVSPDFTVVQGIPHRVRHRQRRVESGSKLSPAIHVNGEVSQRHSNYENYKGNGIMHHYNRHFKNWTKDLWVDNLGMDDYFRLNDGHLKFLESGLYFVYVQIYYVDEHDTNGYAVYRNDEMILQCTTTSHTTHRVPKANTCYTAGVFAFSNGDILKIRDIEANRYSIFQRGKSFFGAVKIGDVREM